MPAGTVRPSPACARSQDEVKALKVGKSTWLGIVAVLFAKVSLIFVMIDGFVVAWWV